LDKIEDAVHRIETPLAYSENLYVFRQHVDIVRQRARLAIQHPALSAGAEVQPLRESDNRESSAA
jgi:hypothetical protein